MFFYKKGDRCCFFFFFSSRRRHTRFDCDWSSDVCSSDLRQALVDSAIEYAEEMRRSGHYLASDALQRTQTARTVRIRAGKASTTVGPFVETEEQLGGFFVIEAKDMDEACAVAARFPPARVAVIEIRPVQELMHSRDRRGLPS